MDIDYDLQAQLQPVVPEFPGHAVGDLPMRIRLCGVDLLPPDWDDDRLGESGWAYLSPLDVATYGLYCVREAKRRGVSAFPLSETGGALLFKRSGDRLLVYPTLVDVVIDAPFDRVERDWEAFSARFEQSFTLQFPQLSDDPIWRYARGSVVEGGTNWDTLWSVESRGRERRFDRVDVVCD